MENKSDSCCQNQNCHCRCGFNLGRLFLGLLLIFGGLVYLAKNLGWLSFDLRFAWRYFWPVLVIFLGFSFISPKSWWGNILGVLAALLILAVIVLMIFGGCIWGY